MKAELDGTFRQWHPNKGEFSTHSVPKNFIPDHVPSDCGYGGGAYHRRARPTPEMLPVAIDLLKTGIRVSRAMYTLASRLNISHESAASILKQARKAME